MFIDTIKSALQSVIEAGEHNNCPMCGEYDREKGAFCPECGGESSTNEPDVMGAEKLISHMLEGCGDRHDDAPMSFEITVGELKMVLAALRSPGMVMEPTEEMGKVGVLAGAKSTFEADMIFRAMIAARPKPEPEQKS